MGCDGGTIPKRDELVRTKKKKIECSKEVKNAAKWNNCHLSQLTLQKPIVADLLGNMYNKEAIIEFLLDRSKYENGPEHVRSLKDVKELNLTSNPSYDSNKQENGDESNTINKTQWICSISGIEMNGSFKFYFVFSCGCVFSERAYKSVNNKNMKCLRCEKSYSENDLLILNPNETEIELNENKLKSRKEAQAKAKAEKQASKSNSDKKDLNEPTSSSNNLKRQADSKNSTSSNSSTCKKIKSIQSDPNASDVFKSLFNTCEKAKNQQKAHWVTFNPMYN